jgi:hypothetical protein
MLHIDDNGALDLPGNKEYLIHLSWRWLGIGQAKRRITLLTFALLLTWTLSSMDCGHLQNC